MNAIITSGFLMKPIPKLLVCRNVTLDPIYVLECEILANISVPKRDTKFDICVEM